MRRVCICIGKDKTIWKRSGESVMLYVVQGSRRMESPSQVIRLWQILNYPFGEWWWWKQLSEDRLMLRRHKQPTNNSARISGKGDNQMVVTPYGDSLKKCPTICTLLNKLTAWTCRSNWNATESVWEDCPRAVLWTNLAAFFRTAHLVSCQALSRILFKRNSAQVEVDS